MVSLRSEDFGSRGGDNETAIFQILKSNLVGKNHTGQCLMGSFNGALSSQNVTEEFKGWLGPDGNRTGRANA